MTVLSNDGLFKDHYYLLEQYKALRNDNHPNKINSDLISFYQEVGKQDIYTILAIEKQACEYENREYKQNATERSLGTINALEFIGRGIENAKTPENVFGIIPIKPKENITKKDLGSDNVNKAINNHINFLSGRMDIALEKDGACEARKKNMETVRTYYTDKQLELVKKERLNQTQGKATQAKTKASGDFSLSSFTQSKKEARSKQSEENKLSDGKTSSRKR